MTNWCFDREIKEVVGNTDLEYTDEDTRITQINKTTTQTLENLLGRSLTKQAYTEYFDSKANVNRYHDVYGYSESGYGGAYKTIRYYLKAYPVDTSATFEVHYQPNMLIDGSSQLAESDYVLNAETGELIITKAVGSYPRAIRVVYTAGYEAAVDADTGEEALSENLPADLVQAFYYQAAHTYEKMKFSNINVRESRSQGSTNSSRYVNIHAIAPEAMAIVVQYKRRNIRIV